MQPQFETRRSRITREPVPTDSDSRPEVNEAEPVEPVPESDGGGDDDEAPPRSPFSAQLSDYWGTMGGPEHHSDDADNAGGEIADASPDAAPPVQQTNTNDLGSTKATEHDLSRGAPEIRAPHEHRQAPHVKTHDTNAEPIVEGKTERHSANGAGHRHESPRAHAPGLEEAQHHVHHDHDGTSRANGAPPPAAGHLGARTGAGGADDLYDLHIQLLNSATDLPHATKAQAKAALAGHASNIATWISAAQDMHRSLAQLHADSPITNAVSEGMAGASEEVHEFWTWTKQIIHHKEPEQPKYLDSKVQLPDTAMWDLPLDLLNAARAQLQAGEIEEAIARLNDAAAAYRRAYQRLREYKERTEGGAASTISALHIAEAAGAISFSVITGGAGSGLAGSAVAAGLGAGGYAVAKGTAEQASEKAHGLRDSMDWKAILKDGAEEAITTFVGALVSGALSKLFLRKIGEQLLFKLGKDEIGALAARARVAGEALQPELFVTKGWAFIADLAGGVGSSPVLTAVSTVVHGGISGEWPKTREEFVDRVIGDMAHGAFFQVLMGALTRGKTAHGGKNEEEIDRETGGRRGGDKNEDGGDHETADVRGQDHHDSAVPTQAGYHAAPKDELSAAEPNGAAPSADGAALEQSPSPAAPSVTTEQQRVTEPVEGHYEGIDPTGVPDGWTIGEDIVQTDKRTGVVTARTTARDPEGRRAEFRRSYDPQTKQLTMHEAFLHPDSPRWVTHGGAMMTGKGTPTQSYWTMRQMRRMGVGYGEVQKVKMSTIQNFDTILQLERAKLDGMPLEEVLPKTASVKYADTPLTQSGGRIVPGSVKKVGGERCTLDWLMRHYEGMEEYAVARKREYAKLLEKYGFTRDYVIEFNFNITFDVAPTTPGSPE